MKKAPFTILLSALATLPLLVSTGTADDAKTAAPSIKQIMKDGFKGDDSLSKKATQGKLTKEEIAKLAEYCAALAKDKPTVGDEASWKEKTAALSKAVADIQAGTDGAAKAYEAAVNCKACHDVHKPKKK